MISNIGGPVSLVGHSYGGIIITNAAYNNPNVTGLVYIAAFVPDEGQSLSDLVNSANFPKEPFLVDSGGFIYLNPEIFRENFLKGINPVEADLMTVVQKPFNQSILAEKSGPPTWRQLPTWFQVSESDRVLPRDLQPTFAQQMNATTLTLYAARAIWLNHLEVYLISNDLL